MAQIEYTQADRVMLGYGLNRKGSVMSRLLGASLIIAALVLCAVLRPESTTSLLSVVALCAALMMAGLSCFMVDLFRDKNR